MAARRSRRAPAPAPYYPPPPPPPVSSGGGGGSPLPMLLFGLAAAALAYGLYKTFKPQVTTATGVGPSVPAYLPPDQRPPDLPLPITPESRGVAQNATDAVNGSRITPTAGQRLGLT